MNVVIDMCGVQRIRTANFPNITGMLFQKLELQLLQNSKEHFIAQIVELSGIEPLTSWLQTRRSPN
jgi:hypothetical protein